MHLIQLLLPLYDADGHAFSGEQFRSVRDELASMFRGVTVYCRAPAEGLWRDKASTVERDELLLFELMIEHLDPAWWRHYRERLQVAFRQEQIIVRAHEITLL